MKDYKILYILIFINIVFSIFIFSKIFLLNNNLEKQSNVDIIKFEKEDKVELIEKNMTDEFAEYKFYQGKFKILNFFGKNRIAEDYKLCLFPGLTSQITFGSFYKDFQFNYLGQVFGKKDGPNGKILFLNGNNLGFTIESKKILSNNEIEKFIQDLLYKNVFGFDKGIYSINGYNNISYISCFK